jgi:nucleoside diphosphate kinase
MSAVKMIKPDAIVKIEIGAMFMQRIQKLFLYLANNLTQEQLQEYREQATKGADNFTEEWMDHITTLSILLKEIETKAIEQNLAFDQDDATSTQEDNQ